MIVSGEGWGKGIVREFGMDMYKLLYLKWITNKDLRLAQGTLLNVVWQPGWERSSEENQFNSVAQSCRTLCDPMDCKTPGFPVHHQLPQLTQTPVHRVSDIIHHLILCRPLQSFPASESILMSQLFPSGGQIIGA